MSPSTTPPSLWTDIVKHTHNGRCSLRFSRLPAVERRYSAHRKGIDATYCSFADYVKINLLQWQAVMRDGKYVARATRSSKRSVLMLNEYPYHLAPGITHAVLWSTVPLSPSTIIRRIRREFDGQFVWFTNTYHRQSIPSLWHCHVMVAPK
jgi:hypothetical protein